MRMKPARGLSAACLVLAAALAPTLAHAWPWSRDMADQIAIKPQAPVPSAGRPMPFPARSVPVPGTPTVRVADRDAAGKLPNPVPANAASIAQGKALFGIYCTPCHGASGKGDGLVGEKLVLRPFDLTSAAMKEISDGLIFGYMTFGGAVMPVYANDLSPTERWHVVNYVRNVLAAQGASAQQASSAAK
jgi:mono/diheme cytochrome c family protein